MIALSRGEKIFNIINITLFGLFTLMILLPVIIVLKQSFDIGPRGELELSLIPRKISLFYYKIVVSDKGIYRPFLNSIYITTVGTLVALTFNAMGAYTLSKRDLPGNRIFIYMIVITMMFSGGLVPLYLVVKAVGLIDKINGLILMSFVNGWNMILIRNYYWSIPSSLPESARMDGANEFIIFSRIIIPLSKPVLAAIALFTGVGYWNMFFHAVIFINSPEKYTFPVKLNEMIVVKREMVHQFEQMAGGAMDTQNLNIEGVSSAIIILSMIPVIIVYPYLQKYFARGILIGSIKG